ncbi:MAG: c-type cytochrome, partial [bacterium]|nr:c-type cytochrome [bacterium]
FAQSPDAAGGERLFKGHCARCHGMEGGGGEGANLARAKLRHATDEEALFSVIKDGIPGTGMPGAWSMSDSEVRQVSAYVLSLGRTSAQPVSGDPQRGESIYRTKGGCSVCHIVGGEGRSRGPDLTGIGDRRGIAYLREALLNPGTALPEGPSGFKSFLSVRAVTADDREVRGIRVSEDSFTIQLRDADNRLHSIRKTALKRLEKEFDKSPMPSYESTLSSAEVDDLVAYL